jgi:outer membrane protein assembly factor BamA
MKRYRALFFVMAWLTLPWGVVGAQDAHDPTGPPPHSPWLWVPLLSSNPKLGTSLGLMAGYVKKFDERSEPSLFAVQVQRSNTSSRTFGTGGKAYWNQNNDQLQFGAVGGKVTNDYLDFLGTGQEVRSDENLRGYFLRYQHQVFPHWYLGGQGIYTNYGVDGVDPTSDQILDMAGLAGTVSSGLGAIASYDTRDNTSNPTSGMLVQLHNFAFRDALGSDDNFDVVTSELKWYGRTSDYNIAVIHAKWRWSDDAPSSKQSTVELRGYTRGQYVGRNSLTLEAEDRYMFKPRWGAKVFAGAACLYGDGRPCGGDNLYPMAGVGVFYVVKPESNMVITAEFAKGNGENRGFYVNFGHRF